MVWLSVGNGRSCRLRFGNQHDGYKEVWPFFVIGFVVAAISQLTLIALGALGVALALIYLNLSKMGGSSNNGGGSNSGDPLGDILNDY